MDPEKEDVTTASADKSLILREICAHPDRVLKSLALLPCFIGVGMVMSILGPSLMDLQIQTHIDSIEEISFVMTSRAAGGLAGCLLGMILGSS
jgi:hypothetical protein